MTGMMFASQGLDPVNGIHTLLPRLGPLTVERGGRLRQEPVKVKEDSTPELRRLLEGAFAGDPEAMYQIWAGNRRMRFDVSADLADKWLFCAARMGHVDAQIVILEHQADEALLQRYAGWTP